MAYILILSKCYAELLVVLLGELLEMIDEKESEKNEQNSKAV
jgi:hypothetical protein